jgi:hypothetical protein
VIGDIQADQLTFPVEHLAAIHICDIRQHDRFGHTGCPAEETHLSGFCCPEVIAAYGNETVQRSQQRCPVAKTVHRTHFD